MSDIATTESCFKSAWLFMDWKSNRNIIEIQWADCMINNYFFTG